MFDSKEKKNRVSYWIQKAHLFRKDEYICAGCHATVDKPYKTCPSCRSQMKKSGYDPSWVDEAEMMDILFGD